MSVTDILSAVQGLPQPSAQIDTATPLLDVSASYVSACCVCGN